MYHGTVDIGSRQISRYSVAGVVLSAYDLAECNLDVSILFLNQTLKIHSRTKISYSSFLAKDKHKFSWVNSSAATYFENGYYPLPFYFLSGSGSTFVHGTFECS